MSKLKENYWVLFGGQGSPSIFSPGASAIAEEDAQLSPAGSILLSKCHAAFLQEVESLDAASQEDLGINLTFFCFPQNLIKPNERYHAHPVLQATTIYLCQLFHYLAQSQRSNEPFEASFDRIRETTGFSSGFITATVVARSCSLDNLVANGVEGFRLAFWIACRCHFRNLNANSNRSPDSNGVRGNLDATCSLVIRGLSSAQVEEKLSKHCATRFSSLGSSYQSTSQSLHVSAILSPNVVAVSGPKEELAAFEAEGVSAFATKFAHVHGWYHGGNQLEVVVDEVLEDAQRRDIVFSTLFAPMKPLRSTFDGTLIDASNLDAVGFLQLLARHLLVHCVNWHDTATQITASVRELLREDSAACVKLLSFGPSSNSLFPIFDPPDDRINFMELSSFKATSMTHSVDDHPNSIAIVGMSVKLPNAQDRNELWQMLSQGVSAVQEIPESRFQISDYYSEKQPHHSRTMPIKHGAFLNDAFSFDNSFFNISPREAISMDPQQRILLHAAQEALEDAGYVGDSSPSSQKATTGCFIGLATGDYTDNLRNDIDVFYSPGTLRAFHSGRISFFHGFSGPSIVTDTACSSSMVSLYQACRALQTGDCTTAIAGGINVISSPDMYLGLSRGHFLSQTGGCKPFDAAADGYCRAEGCVLFILKRLSDAVAENDNIHGVIRDVMTNQSGNAQSITHPHSPTQIDLFQRLLNQTKVDPRSISVIEAHGTGTQAGDSREMESLRHVFGPYHSVTNPIVVSSIKGNVGHCEAASGAASLAKLLLMLREKGIPPQAGFNTINPHFSDLENSGFVIPRRMIPWNHSISTPRRAMLSNFGAAGSNASLLLEEWIQHSDTETRTRDRSSYVFRISAKSQTALQATVQQYLKFLGESSDRSLLKDVCYTATARRQAYDYRISVSCSSAEELRSKLETCEASSPPPALSASATVFCFSGQGGFYRGVGAELMETFPSFREFVSKCDSIIKGLGNESILGMFRNDASNDQSLGKSERIVAEQCACVVLELALARVFISFGITPDYVVGHSLGEYAALCIAGALSLEDTLRVVSSRAKMMALYCESNASGMLACSMSPDRAGNLISTNPALSELTVACLNGIDECVIGGPLDQISEFQGHCKAWKIKTKVLDVPFAFHTKAMDPILDDLEALGRSIGFGTPTVPIISNVFGCFFQAEHLTGNYFALHAREPVRFSEGLLDLQSSAPLHNALFLDIGPHPSTIPMVRSLNQHGSSTYLGTLQKSRKAWESISATLANISLLKIPVNWREVFAGTSARMLSGLPGHPLKGPKFFVPYREQLQSVEQGETSLPSLRTKTRFNLLPWLKPQPAPSDTFVFETTLQILGLLISGHDVGGTAICPASLFHELALEAVETAIPPLVSQTLVVTNMVFASPLVYKPSKEANVSVHLTKHTSDGGADFKVSSTSASDPTENVHCTGVVSLRDQHVFDSQQIKDAALMKRQKQYFDTFGKEHSSIFRTRVLYEVVFPRVVRYSPEYQSIHHLRVSDSNLEGIGSLKLPQESGTGYISHPVFTDSILHTAGFIANTAVKDEDVCICARVDAVEISYRDIDFGGTFQIYCSLLEVKGAFLADAIVMDTSGQVIAAVRGMEFRRLRLSTFQQMLGRKSTDADNEVCASSGDNLQVPIDLITPCTSTKGTNTPPESRTKSTQDVDMALKKIVMDVGGFSIEDMDYNKPLDELGIDSLMQIEIASGLARAFPFADKMNHRTLSQCETLGSLEIALGLMLQSSVKPTSVVGSPKMVNEQPPDSPTPAPLTRILSDSIGDNPVALHKSHRETTPLCLFHDGSGQVTTYARLRGYDRDVFAFFDPSFGSTKKCYETIPQMAEHYVSLLSKSTHFPLMVGGWSFGGVVAFEAARQLLSKGFEVKGLVLIDSPSPVNHKPLPKEIITSITRSNRSDGQPQEGKHNAALEEEFQRNASLLERYGADPSAMTRMPGLKTIILRSQDVMDTESLVGLRYDWLSNQNNRDASIAAWENLVCGHIKVLPIPGNHFEAFSPANIAETGSQLWKACQHIESS